MGVGGRTGFVRRYGFATGALVLVWAALWLVRPTTPLPSPAPLRTAVRLPGKAPLDLGGVYLCPLDAPYRAYARRAYHFFAPNHPLLPDSSERPDRCFSTSTDAVAAGFSAAQGPPGSREVDGVYLVPDWHYAPDGFGPACLRAARRLGFAVPCPGLVPNVSPGQEPPGCGARGAVLSTRPPCAVQDTVFLFNESGFAVPPGYSRDGIGGGTSLWIAAYRAGKGVLPGGFEPYYARFILCPEARPLERIPLDRSLDTTSPVRGELVLCSGVARALDGYLILRWEERGVAYMVALFGGDTQTNRDLLNAIAAGIDLVAPIPKTRAP